MNHVRASRHFDAHPASLRRIRGTLGIQNRSLASQTVLGWGRPRVEREELLTSYRRYAALYRSWPVPRGAGWARPYVGRMAELMDALRPR
jgi:hypothetical protein